MFLLAYVSGNDVTNENSSRKCFLPRFKIKNYNIEIDGRNFYDQLINDLIKQYDEVRKISTGQVWLHNWLFIRFCLFWKQITD